MDNKQLLNQKSEQQSGFLPVSQTPADSKVTSFEGSKATIVQISPTVKQQISKEFEVHMGHLDIEREQVKTAEIAPSVADRNLLTTPGTAMLDDEKIATADNTLEQQLRIQPKAIKLNTTILSPQQSNTLDKVSAAIVDSGIRVSKMVDSKGPMNAMVTTQYFDTSVEDENQTDSILNRKSEINTQGQQMIADLMGIGPYGPQHGNISIECPYAHMPMELRSNHPKQHDKKRAFWSVGRPKQVMGPVVSAFPKRGVKQTEQRAVAKYQRQLAEQRMKQLSTRWQQSPRRAGHHMASPPVHSPPYYDEPAFRTGPVRSPADYHQQSTGAVLQSSTELMQDDHGADAAKEVTVSARRATEVTDASAQVLKEAQVSHAPSPFRSCKPSRLGLVKDVAIVPMSQEGEPEGDSAPELRYDRRSGALKSTYFQSSVAPNMKSDQHVTTLKVSQHRLFAKDVIVEGAEHFINMTVALAPTHYEFAPSPRSQKPKVAIKRPALPGQLRGARLTPRIVKKRCIEVSAVPKYFDEDGNEVTPRQALARQLGVHATTLGASSVKTRGDFISNSKEDGSLTQRTGPGLERSEKIRKKDSVMTSDDRAIASALRVDDGVLSAIGMKCPTPPPEFEQTEKVTQEVQVESPCTVDRILDPSAEYSPAALTGPVEKATEPTARHDINTSNHILDSMLNESQQVLPQNGLLQKLELRAIQAERRRKVANLHEKLKLQEFGLKLAMLGKNQPPSDEQDQHHSLVRVPQGTSGLVKQSGPNSPRSNQQESNITPSQAEAMRLNQVSAILAEGSLSSRRGGHLPMKNPLSARTEDKVTTPSADAPAGAQAAATKLQSREGSSHTPVLAMKKGQHESAEKATGIRNSKEIKPGSKQVVNVAGFTNRDGNLEDRSLTGFIEGNKLTLRPRDTAPANHRRGKPRDSSMTVNCDRRPVTGQWNQANAFLRQKAQALDDERATLEDALTQGAGGASLESVESATKQSPLSPKHGSPDSGKPMLDAKQLEDSIFVDEKPTGSAPQGSGVPNTSVVTKLDDSNVGDSLYKNQERESISPDSNG